MVHILFDPPSENGNMVGGALIGTARQEYVELCKKMTRRKPGLTILDRDRILKIMYNDVREYIESLSKEEVKRALTYSVAEIFTGIPKDEPDPLVTINIVSLQLSLLFTQYEYEKHDNGYLYDSYDTYKELMEGGNFKDYSYIKGKLREYNGKTDVDLYHLLNPNDGSGHIFMVFIGFLKLDEILDSYLDNVYYIGLSYKTEIVHGSKVGPFYFLTHDLGHYKTYNKSCQPLPKVLEKIKKFREYVKGLDKKIQYSVDFALFFFLHEDPHCDDLTKDIESIQYQIGKSIVNSDNFTERIAILPSIINALTFNIGDFIDLKEFGEAIPSAYRELVEGSDTQLKPEKVEEYLHLVMERYIVAWNDFVAVMKLSGGRRIYHRTKRNRRNKRQTRKGKHKI